jgi:phosphohistidine swiveling domain-containing protein
MNYSIQNVDWVKYLDRKQPLFLFAAFIRPYGVLALEATGFRYHHQLHVFSGDTGTFYKSRKEMEAAVEYFLALGRAQDPRLIGWYEQGIKYGEESDELVATFKKEAPIITKDNFWTVYQLCEQIMLYDTTIPFRIMVAINQAVDANGGACPEDLRETLGLFEHFRAGAKYPDLVEHVFPIFWKAAAEQSGVEDWELLSCVTPLELKAIFEEDLVIDQKVLEARRQWCAFWEIPKTGAVQFEYEKAVLEDLPIFETYASVTELKGNIAFKGKVRGIARILNSTEDMGRFNEGDIIVSYNTNPSLMPALIKCGGIVTDEGGIMCHAAIISRELKKPCVIGTKSATKVFKEGDMVEVDAKMGIVRKI